MRVGWFDAVAARYAIAVTGRLDGVALTNLDRLDGRERVRVCVGYRCHDEVLERIPHSVNPDRETQSVRTRMLESCQPIYEELPGWTRARDGDRLSPTAEQFVR